MIVRLDASRTSDPDQDVHNWQHQYVKKTKATRTREVQVFALSFILQKNNETMFSFLCESRKITDPVHSRLIIG